MTSKSQGLRTRIFLPIIILISLFMSCEYALEDFEYGVYTTFTIKKGNHYAEEKYADSFSILHQQFAVKFDSTAIYKTVDPQNQADINKLYGFSDCNNTDHHVNSARYGWRYNDGEVQLLAYTYAKGKRSEAFLKSVNIDEEYICNIQIEENKYVFTIEGDPVYVEMDRGCKKENSRQTKLYPFFGGDEPAPHDITIHINDLTKEIEYPMDTVQTDTTDVLVEDTMSVVVDTSSAN